MSCTLDTSARSGSARHRTGHEVLLAVAAMCIARAAMAGPSELAFCFSHGWAEHEMRVQGQSRKLLYLQPLEPSIGAVIVYHGGTLDYTAICNYDVFSEQNFASRAVKRGYTVIAPDSLAVSGTKAWLTSPENAEDVDFTEAIIVDFLPRIEVETPVFLTGISSGGYMTVRAGAELSDLIAGFVPVAGGDPYGIYLGGFGFLRDMETHKIVAEPGACAPGSSEPEWIVGRARPPYLFIHHEGDKLINISCSYKAESYLRELGFEGERYTLSGADAPNWWGVWAHFWWSEFYDGRILKFLDAQVAASGA